MASSSVVLLGPVPWHGPDRPGHNPVRGTSPRVGGQAQLDGVGGGGKYAGRPREQHIWHVQNDTGCLELRFECTGMASAEQAPATAASQAEAVTTEAGGSEAFDLAALSLKNTSE